MSSTIVRWYFIGSAWNDHWIDRVHWYLVVHKLIHLDPNKLGIMDYHACICDGCISEMEGAIKNTWINNASTHAWHKYRDVVQYKTCPCKEYRPNMVRVTIHFWYSSRNALVDSFDLVTNQELHTRRDDNEDAWTWALRRSWHVDNMACWI